jgi:anti-sigma B factor antagonist
VAEVVEPFIALRVARDGATAVVSIDGEIEFATAPKLRATLLELVHDGPTCIVLDLAGVSFLDSAGISLLIQAKKRLATGSAELVLRRPRSNVRRVLQVTGVDDLFVIED